MNNTFYITTTLPYVNGEPHIGFALEIVAADVIARYQKELGQEVVFNTGTDEHGQKIFQKAEEMGITPQELVDSYAKKFAELKEVLNVDYTNFIRTTDEYHVKAAQEFWQRCEAHGDIYKRMYKSKYCVGCELEKQDSDLEDGVCPLHPNKEIEIREEENYFFRFSRYQQDLLNLYESNPEFVRPAGKLKEIQAFVSAGLKDFSISRLKEKMSWGIPVPGDDDHVMYVWFDALVNYVSTLGWPNDEERFNKFWPAVQLAGKDNLRQQSAMWQAMLISAGLDNSKEVLINGFIHVDGQKMSKSLGNVISPTQMVDKFGIQATRYLLMNLGPFSNDMDISWDKLQTNYTADLSNGIGNVCSRIAKMCEKNGAHFSAKTKELDNQYQRDMNHFELKKALSFVNKVVTDLDSFLSKTKPWTQTGDEQTKLLQSAVDQILIIATHLYPFMPETAEQIKAHFSTGEIKPISPLFPRIK